FPPRYGRSFRISNSFVDVAGSSFASWPHAGGKAEQAIRAGARHANLRLRGTDVLHVDDSEYRRHDALSWRSVESVSHSETVRSSKYDRASAFDQRPILPASGKVESSATRSFLPSR